MPVNLAEYFQLLSQRLQLDLQAARQFIAPTDKGNVNEYAFRDLLAALLPSRYALGVGEVIGVKKGQREIFTLSDPFPQSGQKDVVLYDPFTSAPFSWGNSGIYLFPIESIYAVIEVKSCFHEVKDVSEAAKQVYEVKRIHKECNANSPSPLTIIFAFSSRISGRRIFNTIQQLPLEERPDFVIALSSRKEGEIKTSIYITHWHYIDGRPSEVYSLIGGNEDLGNVDFVTTEEVQETKAHSDEQSLFLTLGETECALLWFYLFLNSWLQKTDTRIDKARVPNLFAYAHSQKIDLGYVCDESQPQFRDNTAGNKRT